VTADVQVSTALGQLSLAEAATQVAQAELDLAAAGPRPEAVAVAQAQVQQAQTARDLLLVQDGKYAIASPIAGVVTARSIDPGEAALAGVPLLQVADLGQVTLTVYVPEPRIGLVQVGQPVQVRVDAYPGQVFHGTVRHISPRAEFTPKTIQTPEERVQTVFGVEILLENPDGALKPGMPADAEIDVG
jgi:multidrug resistance efflux pump